MEIVDMCGRFTLATSAEQLVKLLDVSVSEDIAKRYNIAPTQQVPVCRRLEADAGRRLDALRWGLVPFWADDLKIGSRMINARSETAANKPAFRAAFKRRRCLIPATGFYEWRAEGGAKQPYLFRRTDRAPFAFAGLWERWSPEGGGSEVESFTILTGPPNELVRPYHDRMPVILAAEHFDFWLEPTNDDTTGLQKLLTPFTDEGFEALAVSREVNNPSNDYPEVLDPIE
jgi:putative SOS response-associated peptidase YedK